MPAQSGAWRPVSALVYKNVNDAGGFEYVVTIRIVQGILYLA